jgi:hypothetical protein
MMRLSSLSARSEASLPLLRFLRLSGARAAIPTERPLARPAFTRLGELDPMPLGAYEATLAAYVAAVASRARAVYQVGRVRNDGLSDLDLIVVPGVSRFDDGQFYSARVRVPAARRLFPHDARPLPFDARAAIRFTSHADRRLVFGEDVLAGEAPARGPEQDLALLLEGYLKYARFSAQALRTGSAPAERLVSKATSLTYSLALFDRLAGDSLAAPYAEASFALRAQLPRVGAARARLLAEMWELYAAHLTALEDALAKRLPIGEGTLADFARGFLRGQCEVPLLDAAHLGARRSAIAHYHAALARDGFFIGSLFAKGAYGAGAGGARERRAALPRRARGRVVAAAYRLGALA